MKYDHHARWQAIRAKGKWRYILTLGLWLGLAATAVMALVDYLRAPHRFTIAALWPGAGLLLLLGVLVALAMWEFAERQYYAEFSARNRAPARRARR